MAFFVNFFVTLIFLSSAWVIGVVGQFHNPTLMSQWIADAYEKKQKLARDIKKKKIVIVSGSNALFGVKSPMLEDTFGVSVLNYGVNAGVELPLTLHLAKRVIKQGDIVLMPLEYPMYSYDGEAGAQMIDYLLSREADFFWEMSLYEELYVLWHVELKRVWNGYFSKSAQSVTEGLYGAHHLDEYGDQIDTGAMFRDEWMLQELNAAAKKPEKYGAAFNGDALGWKYLEAFVKWCESRDAKVIFMPSTLMWDESYKSDTKERALYEGLAGEVKKRGWRFVGEPYNYMYDKSYYFNTNFHLNEEGRERRTAQIIFDLKSSGVLE